MLNRHLPNDKLKIEKCIGYLGRLDIKTKGLDILIEALSTYVYRFNDKIKLLIAGPDWKDQISDLKRMILEKKLNNNVEFMGEMNFEQKSKFFNKIYCLMLPSRHEGQSLVMLESISAKCPVIASKGSNAVDIFEYVNAGIIADTERIAKAINNMIENVNFRKQFYSNNEQHADFSMKKISKITCEVYKNIIFKTRCEVRLI